ncbi:MAG: hypothetical protein IJB86_03505 [Clostridia bacterium]|nr:hypothetical protein [Clostridia bacterium]
MFNRCTNPLLFSYIIKGNEPHPYFRCKIKVYKCGLGTILLAEAVNSPSETLNMRCNYEEFSIRCHNGYGLSAIYSPLPADKFLYPDCEVTFVL